MAEKKIKRNCGLKDIYVAEVTENTASAYTVGTPTKLARAISAKITDKFETETTYSDDAVEDVVEEYVNTEIEIGVNTLSNTDYAKLYDTLYKNGYLLKSGSDKAKEIALGFRSKRTDGTYDFVWYYCGKFNERPDEEFETKGDKIATQTASLKGIFYARQKEDTIDSKKKPLYEIRVNESELSETETDAKTAIADWFSKVQEYVAPTP